jgi:hypothetical protein
MRRSALVLPFAILAVAACSSAPAGPAPLSASPSEAPAGPGACGYAREVADGPRSGLERGIAAWLAARTSADEASALSTLDAACGRVTRSPEGARSLSGDAAACTVLGIAYATGDGAPRDGKKAGAYFYRAASGGDTFDLGGCEMASPAMARGIDWMATMCCSVGHTCERGCESDCDRARARLRASTFEAFERGCAAGRKGACALFALALTYGAYKQRVGQIVDGAGWDDPRVRKTNDALCTQGVGFACTTRGHQIASESNAGGTSIAASGIAAGLFRRGCELGDGSGCLELASALRNGWTAPKGSLDEAGALDAACTNGMRGVCDGLADRYAQGAGGVLRDAARAATYRALSEPPKD